LVSLFFTLQLFSAVVGVPVSSLARSVGTNNQRVGFALPSLLMFLRVALRAARAPTTSAWALRYPVQQRSLVSLFFTLQLFFQVFLPGIPQSCAPVFLHLLPLPVMPGKKKKRQQYQHYARRNGKLHHGLKITKGCRCNL